MQVFMVERELPGIPMDQLAAAQKRAIETAASMTAEGQPIRYLRTTFVPDSGRCMCLFESDSATRVEELNRTAQIPFTKVTPALHLAP